MHVKQYKKYFKSGEEHLLVLYWVLIAVSSCDNGDKIIIKQD